MIIIADKYGRPLPIPLNLERIAAATDEVIVWCLPCDGGEGVLDLEDWACVPMESVGIGTVAKYRRVK